MANIGYFGIKTFQSAAAIGAVLVVNELGLPVEFKHTEPCEPGALARILHGGRLDWHMKLNVIGFPLINSITSPVAAVVCTDKLMFKLQARAKTPLAILTETAEPPGGEVGKIDDLGQGRWLVQVSQSASPVVVAPGDGLERTVQKIAPALCELAEAINLLEPFERLEKALDHVAAAQAAKKE